MQTFPFNYFASLAGPKRLFAGRKELSWPKFFLVLVFLVSFMTIPITLYYANQVTAIPSQQFLAVNQMMDQAGVEKFSHLRVVNGELKGKEAIIFENQELIVGVDLPKSVQQKGTFINFEKTQWHIQQQDNGQTRSYTMNYGPSFTPAMSQTPQEFEQFLEEQFYLSNRPVIILSYSLSLGFILLVMTIMILFGASLFLWMTRKSRFSSIQTFKESANLMLNVLGVGSILAAVVGFVHFDLILMLGIQSTVAVLLLLWIFAKTGFKDERQVAEA